MNGKVFEPNNEQRFQSTLAAPITLTGHGVHSGCPSTLTISPADSGTGIIFLRTLPSGGKQKFCASSAETGSTALSTTLGTAEAGVETIEHLMAAIAAYNLDNLLIEVSANEVPILDGGASSYCNAFDKAGIVRQKKQRDYYVITKPVRVESANGFAEFQPFEGRRFDVEIEFSTPIIGKSRIVFDLEPQKFKDEISKARTFGFLKDVETLWAAGMALGSSLENSIVIGGDDKVINPAGLNYENEFVRHKLLDAIGDTALLGGPFIGMFRSFRGGHALNARLVKTLLENRKAYEIKSF
ncbi:UDP-3-O-acyl-N-acetylglucosamine deacetylase [uncultured Bartonella sp.]|uniref:UDP-3-O-acyl-N-acetylglucosamine deacetylase n=1 Tax=uncultured Bartonella sp. TaxID=104108 RepID=UPI00261F00A1|nr:UDP-3-O-acyl-N-acetylglucosamine deacetylase [uncultured Bartonella sp.]